MSQGTEQQFSNKLINETSPYLLQHAHNPVDWYPWCEEALKKAKEENKPILLSIGYSACHWCHVMEKESFSNEEIAKIMNQHFVCIKVDKEERPDIDDLYMSATVAMNNGEGGWPMTLFLTPDQKPFFSGTYFPPFDKEGFTGFLTILKHFSKEWISNKATIVGEAETLLGVLQNSNRLGKPSPIGKHTISEAANQICEGFDAKHGGFGPPPKFPPCSSLPFLIRCYWLNQEEQLLHIITKTLDGMAQGGIYDHIGGGFSRYSTDAQWLVPHFEKMLYDNALIPRIYLEAYQITKNPNYKQIVEETLSFVARDMMSPEGAFYSSLDAESEGVEGKYYLWTKEEIMQTLEKEEANLFCAYYAITKEGNWNGQNIPHTPQTKEEFTKSHNLPIETVTSSLELAKQKLLSVREKRTAPHRDEKAITGWSAMMISTFAEAARILGKEKYLTIATKAADFLLEKVYTSEEHLLRIYCNGKTHTEGFLEDYTYLADALINLYEASSEKKYLQVAKKLCLTICRFFLDKEKKIFKNSSPFHETLFHYQTTGSDTSLPNPNAVTLGLLIKVSSFFKVNELHGFALEALTAFGQQIADFPFAFSTSLSHFAVALQGPLQLVIVGNREEASYKAFEKEIAAKFIPNKIISHYNPKNEKKPNAPLQEGINSDEEKATLHLCYLQTCHAPLSDPSQVSEAIDRAQKELNKKGNYYIGKLIPGKATEEKTRNYSKKFSPHGYSSFGNTKLTGSKIGFGGYRINSDGPEHGEALSLALISGCNLIDTSTNYSDGKSEECIGSIIKNLTEKKAFSREEIIIVTKVGYLQGKTLYHAKKREASNNPIPEVNLVDEECWHSIHPTFLKEQIRESRLRLQLETIDFLLLHNPEYFFINFSAKNKELLKEKRQEFYERISKAFAYLEEEVKKGNIQYYGVSSNTLASPPQQKNHVSLSLLLEAARDAAGEKHHFRMAQLPFNLHESEALFNKEPSGKTVLEIAEEENIALLTNRPLNAFIKGELVRYADFRTNIPPADFNALVQTLEQLEEIWRSKLVQHMKSSEKIPNANALFLFSKELDGIKEHFKNPSHWREVLQTRLLPQISALIEKVASYFPGERQGVWKEWCNKYLIALTRTFDEIHRLCIVTSQEHNQKIREKIDPFLPKQQQEESLSRKALWAITSTKGVTAALCGMRRNLYVDDALRVMEWPKLENSKNMFRRRE